MIILDTNILSELMRSSPSKNVELWFEQQTVTRLFVTTISIAEISYGIEALPSGKRRNELENAFHRAVTEAFTHRILAFDEAAANIYGTLMAKCKNLGKPISILDGQIAAIAFSKTAKLATRNIRDFVNCDLELIDPFY